MKSNVIALLVTISYLVKIKLYIREGKVYKRSNEAFFCDSVEMGGNMDNIKVLIVGVSSYDLEGADDLPFCINDINLIKDSLIRGIEVEENNVLCCGLSGRVLKDEIVKGLQAIKSVCNNEDTIILYFSGHGTTLQDKKHYLVVTDGLICTESIIKYLEAVKAKNKIIIMDCCMSGNFKIDNHIEFDLEETVNHFYGKGYAVMASSSANQVSYGHPEKPVSVFTDFLSSALLNKFIIREGRKSLFDIKKLLFLYLEVWNKRHPEQKQNPIFKADMGGTIFFSCSDYKPYITSKIYKEYDEFTIYDVEPVHTGSLKRYSLKVILKEPYSFAEISNINKKIVKEAIHFEVYPNAKSEKNHKSKYANIIWVYYGLDESDMINSNYLLHTTWVDDKQDKKWWYSESKYTFMLNEVHISVHSYYEAIRNLHDDNVMGKDEFMIKSHKIIVNIINQAEKVINAYTDLQNEIIDENEMFERMDTVIPEINKLYNEFTEMDFAPDDIREWQKECDGLVATIHNFIFFYNSKYRENRTSDNRMACMDIYIKEYYKDLDKLRNIENKLF